MIDNDAVVYFCSRLSPTIAFFFIIIMWTAGGTITLDGAIIMVTVFLLVTVPFYLLAYGWYHLARRTFSQGVECRGVISKTDVSHVTSVIQSPFHIFYKYKIDGKEIEASNHFRSKSKARDIAVVGKEITVMHSTFGGFSFIRDVYDETTSNDSKP